MSFSFWVVPRTTSLLSSLGAGRCQGHKGRDTRLNRYGFQIADAIDARFD